MKIRRITVVGSGTMGPRIACQAILHGFEACLFDISPEALDRAESKILAWLLEKLSQAEAGEALSLLKRFASLAESLAGADLVIETVSEDLELKRRVFKDIDAYAPRHALIATNSSSIPSSRLADCTRRPEKVFNVNFCDPVHGEVSVEIMGHSRSSKTTMQAGERFLRSIGTVPIVTKKEIMGFAFNRIWRAVKRESLHLVGEGYADFEDIDRAWILLFGTQWGPFGLMDDIGLDVIRDIELQYYRESGLERDKPPAFLEDLIARGRLGVKAGRGFYTYPDPQYQHPGWLKKEKPWTAARRIKL